MTQSDLPLCRWCGERIATPRRGQKFCSDQHRYLWHQNQRLYPGKLDERIREIVREEFGKLVGEQGKAGVAG